MGRKIDFKIEVVKAVFFDKNTVLMCPLCGSPSDGKYFNPPERTITIHCPFCDVFYKFSVEIRKEKKEEE